MSGLGGLGTDFLEDERSSLNPSIISSAAAPMFTVVSSAAPAAILAFSSALLAASSAILDARGVKGLFGAGGLNGAGGGSGESSSGSDSTRSASISGSKSLVYGLLRAAICLPAASENHAVEPISGLSGLIRYLPIWKPPGILGSI